LRELGHRVLIVEQWAGQRCGLLVAVHARKSFESVRRFRKTHPQRPLVVALAGTDLYADLPASAEAQQALRMATRLVVLQPLAFAELPLELHSRTRVIYQSVRPRKRPAARARRSFDACVLAHLRPVKDPFRAALASRLLPAASRVRVLQIGAALDPEMAERARAEEQDNPRYRWLGELPRGRALQVLARSHVMVLSSRLEGGANAVSEAVASGVPVLASRIPGTMGLLGEDYPGYHEVGDERGLARLLLRAETEPGFLGALEAACRRVAPLFDPERERRAWAELLQELAGERIHPARQGGAR
jgi:putative glycosyltransferase (TIGR04348 family)